MKEEGEEEEEMLESEEYEEADSYSCLDPPMPAGKSKNKRKRRFTDEQIRSLESMFESQTKVEPRKKLQLAKELGLQPRQVSIWFQNKRARWKSKQLETEYSVLKADYNALLSDFESLKKEKHSLLKQLQKLADLLEKHPEGNNNSDSGSGAGKDDKKLNRALGRLRPKLHTDDEGEEQAFSYLERQEEPADPLLPYMRIEEPTTDGCCISVCEQRRCFDNDAGCFSDQSCNNNTSQWWEVWPLNE